MAISDADSKILWGRAAGICSNPTCREDLIAILENSKSYNVGEMAHVIAKSEKGPRGAMGGGADSYDNLILLCPTCHRRIDKAPEGEFTEEQIHQWKKDHEVAIRTQFSEITFDDVNSLKVDVSKLLIENKLIWEEIGPRSAAAQDDPGSNLFNIWNLRKLDTVIPNNQKIINMIEANSRLLPIDEYRVFLLFKSHATAFEANQHTRLARYTTFPEVFREVFEV